MTARPTAFERVLHTLGRAIVDGELPAGHADTIEGLVQRTGASRSVVREASRVLVALGMLSAGRRVGLVILGPEHWDVLDPLVVRWRLVGPDRDAQLDELRALRRAIEPAAAADAALAVRDARGDTTALVDALEAMRVMEASATVPADTAPARSEPANIARAEAFHGADLALHAAVLRLSANPMFTRLRAVIDEGLRERAAVDPDPCDVDLHVRVAASVLDGDPEAASALMREIVDRTGTPTEQHRPLFGEAGAAPDRRAGA